MKTMLNLRRRHYLARINTFLIAVALIAGVVACGGGGVEYDLTITSTAGGLVFNPGEGEYTYDEAEVVDLVAESDEGYHFVNWSGDVGTIASVSDATTTITMNGDYSVTANFELGQEEDEAPTEVLLGTTLPVTGSYAGWGQQEFGMQKAVDDINAQGGIYLSEWGVRVPVRLIIKDNQSNFAQVEPLAQDLVLADEVHALLSPNARIEMHEPMSVVANRYGVPEIICGGPFEPWYIGSQGGIAPDYSWFSGFVIATPSAPPPDVPGYTLVDVYFAYMDRVNASVNTNMIAGAFALNDTDGAGWYEMFPGLMEAYGMIVVGIEEKLGLFPMDTTDFTSIIQAWKAEGAEIIWGNCLGSYLGMLLSQCDGEGFQPKIWLVQRGAFLPMDVINWGTEPPLGWGVATEVWWSPNYAVADGFVGIGGRTAASLAEDWAEEKDEPLNHFIGPGYMGGNVDPDAINEALAETDLHTINGWVKFDPITHFSPQPLSVGQWLYDAENEDEPFTLRIIASAPDFIALEGDPIFPKPW
jgi:branched-chain amino acid transport system substrate-binding protein